MLGELNKMQMMNVLISQHMGRLACTDGNKPYIVPVTYAFNGKEIYAQTNEGKKLNIMRKNPHVCMQVDSIFNMANWQSVVITGTFHELKGKEMTKARSYLYDHVLPLMTSSTVHAHEHEVKSNIDDDSRIKKIMYRIRINKMTGRFEKQ
jgi:uncharacterized protein